MSEGKPNPNQELFQKQYDEFQETLEALNNKIGQLQGDIEEHNIVLKTITTAPKDRKCFHMIGGVLIEKTAGEVEPTLKTNVTKMNDAVENLKNEIQNTHKQFEDWKKKTGVKIVSANE
ncbi:Cochaperone prefoldin complex subunit [Komagataella phaffii CBS 7435]|uniref:Prefoldin subunit 2 n=2 Tax=Komagataella phaffii TaxID=460519 RepID=C4R0M1_KOMPG|nr:uncharacterized protein PAS_chr2-1_0833 [Komagataella phaffii GS115]CAH2448437.1 Cochaperone prefoldin complex subunit [Komagataella phaffii CBS 7435]CAY69045.1 hypothetical protein PAS_chr2-1_0833 [Komagataella phaffii GS115]SCV12078.1 Cochaperone prefoldin complex subunit [Komagataella phaffii CBS 7435]